MKRIIKKIKNRENKFYKFIYDFIMFFLHFGIPINSVTAIPYKFIFTLHTSIPEVFKLVLKVFYFEPMFRSKCKKVGKNLRMGRMPYISGVGSIILGDNVYLSYRPTFATNNHAFEDPIISIGDNTFIGSGTSFYASKSITIGKNCLLAANIRIYDSDGHPLDAKKRRSGEKVLKDKIKEVVIDDDVWIGTNSLILKGVHIGARSIVAAGSVVIKDVPPDCVVAGNPAKIVKNLTNTEK